MIPTYDTHDLFMRRVIELSRLNVIEGHGGPFAALVVKNGLIIAEGTNLVTSTNDPTAHAEIVAIRKACNVLQSFQLTGCDVYTSCEPCPMCMGALYWARPSRIFYASTRHDAAEAGFDDSFIYDEISKVPTERTIPMIQLLRNEALIAFEEWKRKTDRIPY
ncbi:MAG: nucleoside deaminase [Bacteroidetes bacterium]|nr:nucleoside deaminase [Bacteroidota bacterium]